MTGSLFWSGQLLRDIVPVTLAVVLFLLVLPLLRVSRLYTMALQSVFFSSEKHFFAEVRSRLSIYWLSFTMRGIKSLLLTLGTFLLLDRYDAFIGQSLLEIGLLAVGSFFGLLVFFFFSRCFYALLEYIYIQEAPSGNWEGSYRAIEWLLPLPFTIAVLILSLFPQEAWGAWVWIGAIVLWRLLLIFKTILVFQATSSRYLLLFLYLCSSEVVPFTLIVGVATKYL